MSYEDYLKRKTSGTPVSKEDYEEIVGKPTKQLNNVETRQYRKKL